MLRALTLICALSLLMGIASCGGDGPVWPGDQNNNPNPPPGNNNGGQYYQLQAWIDLSRTEGPAPLPVNMHAVVKGGKGPFIYRWDVNGDNAYDYAGLGVFEVGVHYASAGLYKIKLEVEDQQGQFFIAYAQVQVKPSGPAAVPDAMPIIGAAPLIVELDGSASYDLDGYIVKWEWDYLSDGIYEYESDTEPTTTTTYQGPGTYNATLRVTDDDGFQDIASVQVVVL